MSWLQKLKNGLSKTSSKLTEGVTQIFTHKKLDQETLDELEELLISSDLGIETSVKIVSELAKDKFNKQVTDEEIKLFLANKITEVLLPVAKQLPILKDQLNVLVMVGVNGNGKTTTIGKLAKKYHDQGNNIMLAAADTFRAAAVEQLKIWAHRAKAKVIIGEENSDPAAVAFRAVDEAKNNESDILLIDTAGRLHNKSSLMDELSKIIRVIKKHNDAFPQEVILVLDATTGQNALAQVEHFKNIVNVTGLVITKLDGTAKGGVVVAIAKKFNLPIYAIGVGEGIEDLNNFNPEDFAKSIVGLS
jgi:fused signal recognition particle receptor